MKILWRKISILLVFFTIINISYANESIPYDNKSSDKIFFCGLNSYIDSLSKYKSHFGKLYAEQMDTLLNQKIKESELGDISYDKDAFDAFVKKIKSNKSFCKNTFYLTTTMKVLKYNKEQKFFPIEGITKSTQYTFNGTSRLYKGLLRFINANSEQNKITINGKKAQKFLKGFKSKSTREYLVRIYFKITNIDIDSTDAYQIESDIEVAIDKIDFIDKAGYVHYTIQYEPTKKILTGDEVKKIALLDKYIKLNSNKFTELNNRLFNLLQYIYTSPSIDSTKLAFLASSGIEKEQNKFKQKRMLQDIQPELEQLVKKIKSNSFTANFQLLLKATYDFDKHAYIPNYYGVSKGYFYYAVNSGGLYENASIFAIKLQNKVLQWSISENDAERYSTRFKDGILIAYDLIIKPENLISLKLEPNEIQSYANSKGRNLFRRNTVGEQAYEKAKFIKIDMISGARKLYGKQNYSKRTLISTEKL